MTERLHSKSFEIDSSHMEDGEVKIRIEFTSVNAGRRDRTWMAMVPLGCVAALLGVWTGIGHEWVRTAFLGTSGALCFLSIGPGRWRHHLRIALAILLAAVLVFGIYFEVNHGRLGRAFVFARSRFSQQSCGESQNVI